MAAPSQVGEVAGLLDTLAIAANRQGRLTLEQSTVLGDRARRERRRRVLKAAMYLGLTVLLVVIGSSLGWFLPLFAIGLLLAALALFVVRPWNDQLGEDVRAGRVETVTGTLQKTLSAASPAFVASSVHLVTIGDRRFVVPPPIWAALDVQRAVRAYYLPTSMTLISIESDDELEGPPVHAVVTLSWQTWLRVVGPVLAVFALALLGGSLVLVAFTRPTDFGAMLAPGMACLVAAGIVAFVTRVRR